MMIRKWSFSAAVLPLWVLVRAAGVSMGQEADPAGADAFPRATQDYGAGFAQLQALGLPDVATGRWVSVYLSDAGPYQELYERDQEMIGRMEGNAWLMEQASNGAYRVVTPVGGTLWVAGELVQSGTGRRRMYHMMEADGEEGGLYARGVFVFVDLAKEMESFRKEIGEGLEEAGEMDPDEVGEEMLRQAGVALLFFAQLYRAGYTNEANVSTGMMFEMLGDPRALLSGAVAGLAEVKTAEVMADFWCTGDWQACHAALERVYTRYAASWPGAGRIRALQAMLARRIEHPVAPELTGAGLTEEERTLARELAAVTPAAMRSARSWSSQVWTLVDTNRLAQATTSTASMTSVVARICLRGTASLPLLAALLEDTYPLPLRSQPRDERQRVERFMDGDEIFMSDVIMRGPAAEEGDAAGGLVTRGDLAKQLLRMVIPQKDAPAPESETFVAEVQAWCQLQQTNSALGLARQYLQQGGDDQISAAATYLARRGVAEDWKRLEAHVMEQGELQEGVSVVSHYVAARGTNVADFVERYAAALEKQVGSDNEDPFGDSSGMESYMARVIQTLRDSVRPLPPLEEQLAQLVSGERTLQEAYVLLGRAFAARPTDDAIEVVLKAALAAERPKDRALLLAALSCLDQAGTPGRDRVSTPPTPFAHRALWQQLLADQRLVEAGDDPDDWQSHTVSERAARAILALYHQEALSDEAAFPGTQRERLERLEEQVGAARLRPLYGALAEAVIGGTPPAQAPLIPSPDDLDTAAREALAARVLRTPSAAQGALFDSLSLAELALLPLLTEDGERPDLCAAAAAHAHRIVAVQRGEGLPTVELPTRALVGQTVSLALVSNLLTQCRSAVAQGHRVAIDLVRGAVADGVTLRVRVAGSRESATFRSMHYLEDNGRHAAVVGARTQGYGLWGGGLWTVEVTPPPGEQTAPAPASVEAHPDALGGEDALPEERRPAAYVQEMLRHEQARFWENVASGLSGTNNVFREMMIQFATKPIEADTAKEK